MLHSHEGIRTVALDNLACKEKVKAETCQYEQLKLGIGEEEKWDD